METCDMKGSKGTQEVESKQSEGCGLEGLKATPNGPLSVVNLHLPRIP